MKPRIQVSLFPFLSVLICTMGILSFLAVTFLMFYQDDTAQAQPEKPVEVNWVGAPPHVEPVLVEARADAVVYHKPGTKERLRVPLARLKKEAKIVKKLRENALREIGPRARTHDIWVYMKTNLESESGLKNSFTLAMHKLELYNRAIRSRGKEYYPIILIFPDGLKIYETASFLVETTTQLHVGLEPMLPGWKLPYSKKRK